MEPLHYAQNIVLHQPAISGMAQPLCTLNHLPTPDHRTPGLYLFSMGHNCLLGSVSPSLWYLHPSESKGVITGLLDASVIHWLLANELYAGP